MLSWPSQKAITAMSIAACSKCIAQVWRTRFDIDHVGVCDLRYPYLIDSRFTVLFCADADWTLTPFPKESTDCAPQKTITANLGPQASPALDGVCCS
jgi:hypothetical protein